jgi:hypothetical protein
LRILAHIACSVLAITWVGALRAQDRSPLRPATTGELWLSAGADYKPFAKKSGQVYERQFYRKFHLLGEVGWRSELGPFAGKLGYGSLGTRYRLADFMKVGAEYRYTVRDRYTSNSSRIDLQLWLDWKKDRVDLDTRTEYEHDFIPVTKLRTVLRNRLGIGYNIPHWKLDPQASAEAFTALHYDGNRLVGMRYQLGTDVDLDKKKTRTLGLAVRYDREINVDGPGYRWIFVVSFEHAFRKK